MPLYSAALHYFVSLDEEVNENDYQRKEIKEIFDLIQQDLTTPQEYARMKDEYSAEDDKMNITRA